jgi:hypothetical protein
MKSMRLHLHYRLPVPGDGAGFCISNQLLQTSTKHNFELGLGSMQYVLAYLVGYTIPHLNTTQGQQCVYSDFANLRRTWTPAT